MKKKQTKQKQTTKKQTTEVLQTYERERNVFNAVQTTMVLFTARTSEEKEQITNIWKAASPRMNHIENSTSEICYR